MHSHRRRNGKVTECDRQNLNAPKIKGVHAHGDGACRAWAGLGLTHLLVCVCVRPSVLFFPRLRTRRRRSFHSCFPIWACPSLWLALLPFGWGNTRRVAFSLPRARSKVTRFCLQPCAHTTVNHQRGRLARFLKDKLHTRFCFK